MSGRERASERARVRAHSRDGCSRLGFWQRSLPYPPIYLFYLCLLFLFFTSACDNSTGQPLGSSYTDSFSVSQNFLPSFLCTPLALPQGPPPTPRSKSLTLPFPDPQAGLGFLLAQAWRRLAQGAFCKDGPLVWACDLLFVPQFW